MNFLYICLAGALGTGARYLISGWMMRLFGAALPWGTLAVNFIGSFIIGLLMQIGLSSDIIPPNLRVVLTIGFLGGFTTYSTFNYETVAYFQDGEWLKALLNLCIMVISCFFAGIAGVFLARWLIQTSS